MWKLSFKGCVCLEFWHPGGVFTSKYAVSMRIFFYLDVYSIALYGAETWTIRVVDRRHLENFEMWCWRRMEKISWTDHVIKEEILLRAKKQRKILHEISKRKAN
jgi:hypothetical protein